MTMKIITMLKKSLASSIAFALIALSPGLAPYEAAAQMRSAPAVPVESAPLGVAPLSVPTEGLGASEYAPFSSGLEAASLSETASLTTENTDIARRAVQ